MKKYNKYKDSGVKWLGKIPKNWIITKLKFYLSIQSGAGINNRELNDKGEYLVYGGNGIMGRTNKSNSSGDVLIIGRVGALCGNVHLINDDVWISDNALWGKSSQNQKYLFYYLKYLDLNRLANKNAQPLITGTIVKEQVIGLPTKIEQTQIAAYLDYKTGLIDKIITKKEALIQKLKEQRQAIIKEAVTKGVISSLPVRQTGAVEMPPMKDSGIEWLGKIPEHWEVVKLKYLGASITGITYSPNDVSENGTLVLRSSNIQNGVLSLKDTVYVKQPHPRKYNTQVNDILLCSRNGSRNLIGKNILLDERVENQTWDAFMTVFRSEYNRFIYYFFNSDIFNELSSLFLSSTINQLTIGVINNMQVAFPKDKKEREKIINYLDTKSSEINKIVELLNNQVIKLKQYRQSIISEAVTGKIDVREWQPPYPII